MESYFKGMVSGRVKTQRTNTGADWDSSFPGSGSGEDMFMDSVDRPQALDTTGMWAERQDLGLVRLHIFVFCLLSEFY